MIQVFCCFFPTLFRYCHVILIALQAFWTIFMFDHWNLWCHSNNFSNNTSFMDIDWSLKSQGVAPGKSSKLWNGPYCVGNIRENNTHSTQFSWSFKSPINTEIRTFCTKLWTFPKPVNKIYTHSTHLIEICEFYSHIVSTKKPSSHENLDTLTTTLFMWADPQIKSWINVVFHFITHHVLCPIQLNPTCCLLLTVVDQKQI